MKLNTFLTPAYPKLRKSFDKNRLLSDVFDFFIESF